MGKKLPSELPPEVSNDEIEVSDEDLQFVDENKDYAGFVSNLDTQSINRHVTRVANVKDDALESLYARRKKSKDKEEDEKKGMEIHRVDALPVKTLAGKLYYRTEQKVSQQSVNGNQDDDDNEANGEDKGLMKLTKAEKNAKLKKLREEAKKQAKEMPKEGEVEQTPQAAVSLVKMEEDNEQVKSFKELGVCDQLVEASDSLGWKNPSKIQAEAIPHALEGKDLIGLAQTGSGKTGAFALPILQALLDAPQAFFACVLSPTRELAIQIAEQFEALGSGIGVKCVVLVGGIDSVQQSISLGKRPHIVVATPGRLVDHLSNTKGFTLRTVKYLVLDEADRLLNEDFEKELNNILEVIPRERKTYLFSATMTKKVKKLQRACLRNPVKIEAASKYSTVDTLKQQYLFVPAKYKDCYLIYLLTEMSGSTTMVFTRTCDATRLLALMLRNLGFRAIPISGQMSQTKRLGALNKFKAGECNILVCTDVASRGLDIPSVDMVINYDIPSNSKDYIHRVGRTARAGRSGVAISIVNQYEVEYYFQIEKLIGKKLPQFPAEEEEVLLLLERVTEATRISKMKIKEGGSTKRRRGGDDDDNEKDRYLHAKSSKKGKKK